MILNCYVKYLKSAKYKSRINCKGNEIISVFVAVWQKNDKKTAKAPLLVGLWPAKSVLSSWPHADLAD